MKQRDRTAERGQGVEVLAGSILHEILRADMTMHRLQFYAWREFIRRPPKGAYIHHDITEGIPQSRYLFLNDVRLALHVRPLFTTSFLSRIKTAWRVLIGRLKRADHLNGLAICAATDTLAVPLSLRIRRSEHGGVSVQYRGTDPRTNELLSMKKETP